MHCDKIDLYDNSNEMEAVAKFNQGNLVYKAENLLDWIVKNPAVQTLKDYYFCSSDFWVLKT